MAGTATSPGTASELKAVNAANGKTLQSSKDFLGKYLRVAKHREGAPQATYIVSFNDTANIWIYALTSPHPPGKTALLGPARYASPASTFVREAAYSNGKLYLVNSANSDTELGVHMIPISLADVSGQKTIDPSSVRHWTIKKVNEKIDYATIDVTSKQHVVVGYRAFNKNTMPNLARYAILYNGENAFRPSQNAVSLPGSSGTGFFRLDYFGSQRDMLDPTGVWALLADENGVVMMFVRP